MAARTVKTELDRADLNNLADVIRKIGLGSMLEVQEYDTGTITASATVSIPSPGALIVQSARVVTSGTAGSVGSYLVSDSGATLSTPTAASTQAGVAKCSADGLTITFPNTVTRAVIRYIKNPATTLSTEYANG